MYLSVKYGVLPLILWIFPYQYTGYILVFLLGYIIGRFKDILLFLEEKVSNERYSSLIHRLLSAFQRSDIDETRELLIDIIYFIQGTTRYRPIRYVGDTFVCPMTRDNVSTGDIVLILPCGHMGKYTEMKQWIDTNTACPICKASS